MLISEYQMERLILCKKCLSPGNLDFLRRGSHAFGFHSVLPHINVFSIQWFFKNPFKGIWQSFPRHWFLLKYGRHNSCLRIAAYRFHITVTRMNKVECVWGISICSHWEAHVFKFLNIYLVWYTSQIVWSDLWGGLSWTRPFSKLGIDLCGWWCNV